MVIPQPVNVTKPNSSISCDQDHAIASYSTLPDTIKHRFSVLGWAGTCTTISITQTTHTDIGRMSNEDVDAVLQYARIRS